MNVHTGEGIRLLLKISLSVNLLIISSLHFKWNLAQGSYLFWKSISL